METPDINKNISDIPARSGRLAIYAITVIASLLLLIAHKGIEQDWPLFQTAAVVTLWYSVAIAIPFVTSFLISSENKTFIWYCGLAVFILVATLAWHTGNAYSEEQHLNGAPIFLPYIVSLTVGLFILLPFMQLLRDGRRKHVYARLYQLSWDNALTLITAGVFTLACWLILWLWAGLFDVIGIDFFEQLFSETLFIYPVTGLFSGFGIGLGRTQIGAMRTALNVCLAIARPLLPLICAVALLFLIALGANDIEVLWNTGSATTLLLCLILGTITLVNAVMQDGHNPAPYGLFIQWLTRLGLLTLPILAVIAMHAMQLRVSQYGWSVDRLYAALITLFASFYALGYAVSSVISLFRINAWVRWIANTNILLAVLLTATLFLSQSPLLDFRQLTVSNQLQRISSGDAELEKLDLHYFRFELGKPGYEALQALMSSHNLSEELHKRIENLLASSNRHENAGAERIHASFQAGHIRIWPEGREMPAGLLEYLGNGQENKKGFIAPTLNCARKPGSCVLMGVDLDGNAQTEWVFIDSSQPWYRAPVFVFKNNAWSIKGYMVRDHSRGDAGLEAALANGEIRTRRPEFDDLLIGNERLIWQP